jgi:mono/diheme cytochrome c family protein
MKKTIYIVLTAAAITAGISSCSKDRNQRGLEYMPDMYRSSSYEVYSGNPNFKDSLTMQHPVVGTLPRGYEFFPYPSTNEGYEAAGRDLKNPLAMTKENLEEGKRLYSIFCMHCHGEGGQADGSLIATGKFPPPPSYTTSNSSRGGMMKDLTDGKIYHTITYGINLMGSHASQVNPTERWKIVMYVRSIMSGASATAAASSDSTATASK